MDRLSSNRLPDNDATAAHDQGHAAGDVAPVIRGDDDAMTQFFALDLWAASLPHIDSDVSDDDDDGYCCNDSREYATTELVVSSPGLHHRSGAKPAISLVPPIQRNTPPFKKGKTRFFLSSK